MLPFWAYRQYRQVNQGHSIRGDPIALKTRPFGFSPLDNVKRYFQDRDRFSKETTTLGKMRILKQMEGNKQETPWRGKCQTVPPAFTRPCARRPRDRPGRRAWPGVALLRCCGKATYRSPNETKVDQLWGWVQRKLERKKHKEAVKHFESPHFVYTLGPIAVEIRLAWTGLGRFKC